MLLDLRGKLLRLKSEAAIQTVAAEITSEHTGICLAGNGLGRKFPTLKKIITALPPQITFLDLSNNDLHKLSAPELSSLFSLLHHMRELNLNKNNLGFRSCKELASAVKKLPRHLRVLWLNENELKQINDFPQFMLELQLHLPNLEELNLDKNGLGFISPDKLVSGLGHLTVIKLSLQFNDLATRSIPALAKLVASLNVRMLNLAHNHLGQKPEDRLKAVFCNLQDTLEQLDLSDNVLSVKSWSDLITIFTSIPSHVHVNIHKNFSPEQEKELIKLLPRANLYSTLEDTSRVKLHVESASLVPPRQECDRKEPPNALPPLNFDQNKQVNYYFYLKVFAALSVTSGTSCVLIGVLVLQSTTVVLAGTTFIFVSAAGLAGHGFFSKSREPTTSPRLNENEEKNIELSSPV
ncbi:leucine-rich repeat-containing protein (substrate of the Dot/Icm secretion system) (plasmid) [Legionella adelaidensis]|uniref:Leucine-rich repeat-containing protein (Substrate of the Dot/Icm secretion system) n=1 Tax=Legionella adelaidensis TaxID=45056 RepID=A0A0W0R3R5_9GAMM|nr:hypothetical protein [Legionella adelaidensis]KTC65676.1 leucine-rich repeat-containing protein (substrate of the Dot/Icm secretion system) [Legionella adelaidensis]VEH85128.1 leucine-rich repeat-containing protein (substrate of the Dot/Icm secretion system) [Legionella adelaidensis]